MKCPYENCKFRVIRFQPPWMWSTPNVGHFQGTVYLLSAINLVKIHKLLLSCLQNLITHRHNRVHNRPPGWRLMDNWMSSHTSKLNWMFATPLRQLRASPQRHTRSLLLVTTSFGARSRWNSGLVYAHGSCPHRSIMAAPGTAGRTQLTVVSWFAV